MLLDPGRLPQVPRDVIDGTAGIVPAQQEQHPSALAVELAQVGAAVPAHGQVGDVGPVASVRLGPFHVAALDVPEVGFRLADVDVAPEVIRVIQRGFLLLQQPVDVGLGDLQRVGHGAMRVAADADQHRRLILEQTVGNQALTVKLTSLVEVVQDDHGWPPKRKTPRDCSEGVAGGTGVQLLVEQELKNQRNAVGDEDEHQDAPDDGGGHGEEELHEDVLEGVDEAHLGHAFEGLAHAGMVGGHPAEQADRRLAGSPCGVPGRPIARGAQVFGSLASCHVDAWSPFRAEKCESPEDQDGQRGFQRGVEVRYETSKRLNPFLGGRYLVT